MRRARFGSDALSVQRYSALNRDFHAALVAMAGNPLFTDMQRRLYAGRHFATVFVGREPPAREAVVAEHQRILDRLRRGRVREAARALREHIIDSLERDARMADVTPALRRLLE